MEVVSGRFRPAGAMRVFSKPQTTPGKEIRWKKQNVRSIFMTPRNKRDFRQGTATRIMHVRRRAAAAVAAARARTLQWQKQRKH